MDGREWHVNMCVFCRACYLAFSLARFPEPRASILIVISPSDHRPRRKRAERWRVVVRRRPAGSLVHSKREKQATEEDGTKGCPRGLFASLTLDARLSMHVLLLVCRLLLVYQRKGKREMKRKREATNGCSEWKDESESRAQGKLSRVSFPELLYNFVLNSTPD